MFKLDKPTNIYNLLHEIQHTITEGRKFMKKYLLDKYNNSLSREYIMILDIETTEMFKIKK